MKDVKPLIVGFGSVGRRHTRNLQALGVSDFVFLRTNKGQPQDSSPPPGPVVTSVEEALNHHPNVAIIANPSSLHLATALPLARAGLHLFIDKPLCSDAELKECETLAKVCDKGGLTTMIGCQFRFHPLLQALASGLEKGKLGRVVGARAEWGHFLPDWHPWEDHRKGYAARTDLGGGSLLTLIHPIDYLYWLFGTVRSTSAFLAKVPLLETQVEDDVAMVNLRFDNGVLAHVHLDLLQLPPVHQLQVWGDSGRVLFDYHQGTLTWCVDGNETQESNPDNFERNDMFMSEMRAFLEAVEHRRPSPIPLSDGIATLKIVRDARRSNMLFEKDHI